jgi:molecular chaperone GrpE
MKGVHARYMHGKKQGDAQRYLEGWKRARADYENLHRRLSDERVRSRKEGFQEAFQSIFSILDYFDAAFASVPEDIAEHQWVEGVRQIEGAFRKILEDEGIRCIEEKEVSFDPTCHEAVEYVPSKLPTGTVVSVTAKGYMMNDEILRPAKVQVSAGPRGKEENTRVSADAGSSKEAGM